MPFSHFSRYSCALAVTFILDPPISSFLFHTYLLNRTAWFPLILYQHFLLQYSKNGIAVFREFATQNQVVKYTKSGY